jgi:hypothetical protein
MTANELLKELFNRLEAAQEPTVKIGWGEVESWPEGRLEQFIAAELLKPADKAKAIICNGCEEQCLRPVHIYPSSSHRSARLFISCDKRDDTSRVSVASAQLQQWQISRRMLAQAVAALLPLTGKIQPANGGLHWQLGTMRGRKGVWGLVLDFSGPPALKVGEYSILLEEVMFFKDDQIAINEKLVISAVNRATTADIQTHHSASETRLAKRKHATQERRKRCQKAYLELQRKHPGMSTVWYSQQIAKMAIAEHRTPETIRRQLRL